MTPELQKKISVIAQKKIYFGHQSVGGNIIDGLKDLLEMSGENNLNILNLHHSPQITESYFAHSYIGKNTDAHSKCMDFGETLKKTFHSELDFALLKFCFVDMRGEDNPETIFELYKNTIDTLKSDFPHTTFIHATIPLTSHNVNFKLKLRRLAKKILSKRDYSPIDNINRYKYNQLLRAYYKDELIFDIAKIESTYSDGRREVFIQNQHEYESLIFEYSYDAAHLNEFGRQRAALELIGILAEVIKNKSLMRK
jgi:hypothetical protein